MTTHTGMDPYIERTDLFIDGGWQPPLSTETYTVVSPATEEPIGRVPVAGYKDVDRAVAAARRAFEGPRSPWAAATHKVLDRAGLSIGDLDAYEVNEAFAPVPLLWQHALDADPERLNARGGAIALGHPLGASGTRLLTTLVNQLEATRGRYGLQAMCEGGGMANATVIERL